MNKRLKKLKRYKRPFWTTLFWHQNEHHKHGVLVHTLKVTYHLIKKGRWDLVPAGLLHDLGKPFTAHKKTEDIGTPHFSFTNHEEASYHLIKNWKISDYTKNIVRWHYLIRAMNKEKKRNPKKYKRLKRVWDGLDDNFKKDLGVFLACDDLGKK